MIDDAYLAEELRRFAKDRDWDQFHTPKNIAASISVESAELLEIFQWSKGNDWIELSHDALRTRVEEELADVLLYLLRFADLAGIDLQEAAKRKLTVNAKKYPVERSKGTDRKYGE